MKEIHSKRNIGIQAISSTKEYIPPSVAASFNLELVEYPKYLVLPHVVICLVLICSLIGYLALQETTMENSLKYSLTGLSLCFICFGCMYLPDTIMRRPHPVFWRFIQSLAILYMIFLAFFLFLPTDKSRDFLKIFDPSLGSPLAEKNYAEDCDLSKSEFPYIDVSKVAEVCDFYMLAHLIGWFIKMLIVRDVYLCWFLSIFFEFLELTFRHWLPNFKECWWDYMILDVFGCNALGIWLGHMVIHYFEMKNLKWLIKVVKNEEIPQTYSYKNIFHLFHPTFLSKHDWNIFSSFDRFKAVIWYIFFLNMVDLSHFFMKHVLWIPPDHNILFFRINFWACFAIISTREYFEYVTNESSTRFGQFNFLAHLILFLEWMIIFKNRGDNFTQPFPIDIVFYWAIIFIILAIISAHLMRKECCGVKRSSKKIDLVDTEVTVENFDPLEENLKNIVF